SFGPAKLPPVIRRTRRSPLGVGPTTWGGSMVTVISNKSSVIRSAMIPPERLRRARTGTATVTRDAGEGSATTGERPPMTGEAPPMTGEGSPTTGERPPTTGEAPPTTGERPPMTGEASPTAGEGSPTTG